MNMEIVFMGPTQTEKTVLTVIFIIVAVPVVPFLIRAYIDVVVKSFKSLLGRG